MKITMKIPAPEGSVFTEDALLELIGQDTKLFNEGHTREIPAKILEAKVSDDGKTATLTVEVPDEPN